MASRMQKTLQFIQQFSGVVDTFVSSDPSTAALAWGSIKVTILVGWKLIPSVRLLTGRHVSCSVDCSVFLPSDCSLET